MQMPVQSGDQILVNGGWSAADSEPPFSPLIQIAATSHNIVYWRPDEHAADQI